MARLAISVLRNRIGEVSETLRREARAHQVRTADRVRDRARTEAPVRTGFLRDHITTAATRATGTKPEGFRGIAIVSAAPYSTFVHDGTRYISPNPFLLRALLAEENGYVRGFSAVGDAL